MRKSEGQTGNEYLHFYLSGPEAAAVRKFVALSVEPQSIAFMPLAWTLSHAIDSDSPLFGLDFQTFESVHGELLVLIKAVDESWGQMIYARTSYTSPEVEFYACYEDMLTRDPTGRVTGIDMTRFDSCQKQAVTDSVTQ